VVFSPGIPAAGTAAGTSEFFEEHVLMVVDVVRAYLEAASGLTELTRKRAVAAAKVLIRDGDERAAAAARSADTGGSGTGSGESPLLGTRVGPSIQALATELIETSQSNRAALGRLVEEEVARVLDRLDLVPRDDYDRLARRVAELERRLAAVTAAQRRRAAAETVAEDAAHSAAAAPEPAVPNTEEADGAADTAQPDGAPASAGGETADGTPSRQPAAQAAGTQEPPAEEPRPREAAENGEEAATKTAARGGKAKSGRARSTKTQAKRAATRRGSARNGSKSCPRRRRSPSAPPKAHR